MLEAREDRRQHILHAKPSGPRLYGKPDQAQDDALDQCYVLSSHTPDVARHDAEANVPGGSHVTVCDCDERDDHFADDNSDDRLPDGDSGRDQRAAQLPIGESDLVDGPE